MLPKLDKKFYIGTGVDDSGRVVGRLRKAKDDSAVPDDEWCVFLAKDNAFAAILPDYIDMCRAKGCDAEQIAAVEAMYQRVTNWRLAHPERCKDPDAAGETLLP